MPRYTVSFLFFYFDLEFLEVKSFTTLTAKILLPMAWEIDKNTYQCSPNSNPYSINAGTTAGFVKRLTVSSSELYMAVNAVLWRNFSSIAEL